MKKIIIFLSGDVLILQKTAVNVWILQLHSFTLIRDVRYYKTSFVENTDIKFGSIIKIKVPMMTFFLKYIKYNILLDVIKNIW